MGMGTFNSDDNYVYYFGQEPLRRNGVALITNKKPEMQYLGATSKMTEWSCKLFNITVIQVYARLVMLKKLKLTGSVKIYNTF